MDPGVRADSRKGFSVDWDISLARLARAFSTQFRYWIPGYLFYVRVARPRLDAKPAADWTTDLRQGKTSESTEPTKPTRSPLPLPLPLAQPANQHRLAWNYQNLKTCQIARATQLRGLGPFDAFQPANLLTSQMSFSVNPFCKWVELPINIRISQIVKNKENPPIGNMC